MSVRIGRKLSHYLIVDTLGRGGMGVVYRARDKRLERDVALKILPESLLADPAARRRFRREALALSRLNHPGIGTIHDFDTDDGVDFLVMELVAGQTLGERIAMGPLAEAQVIAIGTQIAEALEAAHEQGVVHRDLKPGNIVFTTRGQAKVLDFGLARWRQPADGVAITQTLTETQAVAGTLPYMAPEQLQGRPVDARADIYALGVVLFEMATGRLPYREKVSTALAGEILHRPALEPRSLRPELSPALEAAILRALEKSPDQRFQTARALAEALQAATPSAAGGAPPTARRIESLAVLPLENLSGDPEQEYFADGMTEELIATLAQIAALRVISRTSVMQYKGVRKPLPEIARALSVDAVVAGSVRRAGERVRITAQLIEAASDRHLWAKSYEGDLRDIFSLQGEVARAIAQEVQIQLTPQESARLASTRPADPEAHEAYLKGLFFWTKRTQQGVLRGIEHFERAIACDPGYALAHVGLADSFNVLGFLNLMAPKECFPRARAAALRALEMDDMLAEAHASLAYVQHYFDWDWTLAERTFRRAIELNPGYARAHHFYSVHLMTLGREEEALAEISSALRLDPASVIVNSALGFIHFLGRRYDRAIEQSQHALEMDPSFLPAHMWVTWAYEQCGRFEEAVAEMENALALSGGNGGMMALRGRTLALAGRTEEARRVLDELTGRAKQEYIPAFYMAGLTLALGETDQTFELLSRGCDDRSHLMIYLKVQPWLDPLRSDDRFRALVRRVGLP